MFCMDRRCQFFMLDVRTGAVVKDHRYDVARLEDDDPQKLATLRRFLSSSDYMERLAAVKQLELIPTGPFTDALVEYVSSRSQAGEADSVAPMAINILASRNDVRARPGLDAGLRYLGDDRWREDLIPVDDKGEDPLDRIRIALASLSRESIDLLDAVERKEIEAVKRFVLAGSNIHATGTKGSTALHRTVFEGQLEIAQVLVEAGADVNRRDDIGITPLWLAVHEVYPNIVKYLLDHGGDPNTDRDGIRLLHIAVARRSARVTKILLAGGARRDVTDPKGRTPVDYAALMQDAETIAVLNEGDRHSQAAG